MKLIPYYLLIIVPFVFVFWSAQLSGSTFVVSMLIYAMIYRPIVDGVRLIHLGLLKRSEIWKMFIPFYPVGYIKELYFKR
ncbi:hypothetical protein ABDK00_011210 [Niabella insulamsoli]|uniref:hypothetical protein n=1 Tax=Niabella insulamsoli TaxID=3144874 RepID=UPI0031FBD821